MLHTIERAIDLGVNYFDTASIYGNGTSESNLGVALQELGTDVIVGTKVRLSTSDMAHIGDAVLKSIEASLKRLKLDCIDIIHLHNPISLNRDPQRNSVGLKDLEPVIQAFQLLQEEGKVKFYGINGLGETEALHHAVEVTGAYSIQTCYNLINPSASQTVPQSFPFQDFRQLIPQASKHEIGVIAIRVLAAGALSGTIKRHPNAAKTVSPIATSADYAQDVTRAQMFRFLIEQDYTDSLVEAAIRFTISNPAVSTALVGFSNLEQLEKAAEYVNKGPLGTTPLKQIEEIWHD
jgi:aryl-alcohol dehydrogenase-like predicted oxidoreductase